MRTTTTDLQQALDPFFPLNHKFGNLYPKSQQSAGDSMPVEAQLVSLAASCSRGIARHRRNNLRINYIYESILELTQFIFMLKTPLIQRQQFISTMGNFHSVSLHTMPLNSNHSLLFERINMSATGGAGAAAGSGKFDPDLLLAHFRTCNTHAADVPIESLIGGVEQLKSIICAYFILDKSAVVTLFLLSGRREAGPCIRAKPGRSGLLVSARLSAIML